MTDTVVLMPNYNNEEYLAEAIESCFYQSYPVDIVFVDDGSIDNSVQRVEEIKNKTGNNIHIIRKENGGPASARNAGLKYILEKDSYKYTVLLDSDDYLLEGFVEKCIEVIASDDAIIGAYSDYYILINEPEHYPDQFTVREYKTSFTEMTLWRECLMPHLAVIQTDAFKKVLDANGELYDESLRVCNDYDMDLKLVQHGIIWHIPEVLSVVREGINNSCTPIQGRPREECMKKLRMNNYKYFI